jgi:hypothetical protein
VDIVDMGGNTSSHGYTHSVLPHVLKNVKINREEQCQIPYTVVENDTLKQYTSPKDIKNSSKVKYNSSDNYKKLCSIDKKKKDLTAKYANIKNKNTGDPLIKDVTFIFTMFIRCIKNTYSEEEKQKGIPKIDKDIVECFIEMTNETLFPKKTRDKAKTILQDEQPKSWMLRTSSVKDSTDNTCTARVLSYISDTNEHIHGIIYHVKGLGYYQPAYLARDMQLPSVNKSVLIKDKDENKDMIEPSGTLYTTFIDLLTDLNPSIVISLWVSDIKNYTALHIDDLQGHLGDPKGEKYGHLGDPKGEKCV